MVILWFIGAVIFFFAVVALQILAGLDTEWHTVAIATPFWPFFVLIVIVALVCLAFLKIDDWWAENDVILD